MKLVDFGPPEGIRTPVLQNRNLLRYPAAPRAEILNFCLGFPSFLLFCCRAWREQSERDGSEWRHSAPYIDRKIFFVFRKLLCVSFNTPLSEITFELYHFYITSSSPIFPRKFFKKSNFNKRIMPPRFTDNKIESGVNPNERKQLQQ